MGEGGPCRVRGKDLGEADAPVGPFGDHAQQCGRGGGVVVGSDVGGEADEELFHGEQCAHPVGPGPWVPGPGVWRGSSALPGQPVDELLGVHSTIMGHARCVPKARGCVVWKSRQRRVAGTGRRELRWGCPDRGHRLEK